MPRRHLRLFALLAALITALLTSCGGADAGRTEPPPLPDGPSLLADSAEAMRKVTSTRVGINVEGELPGVPIKSAEGQLTNEGEAEGTATLDMGQQLYEVTFVILGKDLYLRGPTGGFKKLSTSSAFLVYDPTVILDPERGVAGVLGSGAAAKTEGREEIGGQDTYRVQTTFSGQSLGTVVPGLTQDVTSTVWIAADDSRLVQARFPTDDGAVTFRFSDFNAPADITAPN